MEHTSPGRHKTIEAFREHWRRVAPDLDCDQRVDGAAGPLGRELEVFGRKLSNRFCIHPMEGWDGTPAGAPTDDTLRRWRRFGSSGAALIWGGEAFAVCAEGRANPNQLFLNPAGDAPAGLTALRDAARAGAADAGGSPEDVVVGLQLTHSGRFARPTSDGPAPRVAYRHPLLDARVGVTDDAAVLSDGELEGIAEQYVEAARQAAWAGFDFVDLKACHGYLLHELLSARTRPGPYGGDLGGRTRFLIRLIEAVRRACPQLGVGVRISLGDVLPHRAGEGGAGEPEDWPAGKPYPHGFGVDPEDPRRLDLTEPLMLLAQLSELGVREVSVSLGSPYYCPHLQRPAAYPPSDGYKPPEDPLLGVAAHVRLVRACKETHPGLTLVGAGYSYLQEWLPNVAQYEVRCGHVDLIGLGRMALSYPTLPLDVLAGRRLERRRICRTFSDCTTAPRNDLPSGCYPLDEYYAEGPHAGRMAALKRRIRER